MWKPRICLRGLDGRGDHPGPITSQHIVSGSRDIARPVVRAVVIALGAALLLGMVWRLGAANILDAFARIGWYLASVLALGGAHHAVRALALRACMPRPHDLPYAHALAIRLSGEAIQSLTFTGPLLSQPTKAWLLQGYGLTLREGFASTITEYVMCTGVTVAMSITGLVYLVVHFDPPPAATGIALGLACVLVVLLIVGGTAIARRADVIGSIIRGLARISVLSGRLRPGMTSISQIEDVLPARLRHSPRAVLGITVIEAGAQAFLVAEVYALLRGLELMAPGWYALLIESVIKVVGLAFLFVPLQLGVSESAYATLFEVMSMPAAAGFAVAFLRRGRTVAVAALGLATLAVMTRRRARG